MQEYRVSLTVSCIQIQGGLSLGIFCLWWKEKGILSHYQGNNPCFSYHSVSLFRHCSCSCCHFFPLSFRIMRMLKLPPAEYTTIYCTPLVNHHDFCLWPNMTQPQFFLCLLFHSLSFTFLSRSFKFDTRRDWCSVVKTPAVASVSVGMSQTYQMCSIVLRQRGKVLSCSTWNITSSPCPSIETHSQENYFLFKMMMRVKEGQESRGRDSFPWKLLFHES